MNRFGKIGLALVLATAGGFSFYALGLPLPWMLGALFFTMVASVRGVPLEAPNRIRPAVIAIIGVMLGARFTPDVITQALAWSQALGLLLVYLVLTAATVVPFYRFVGGFDWPTAYFSGMPGGLAEMIEMGEAIGAKVPPIILAHSLRIVMTIAMIAVWFRVIQGVSVGATSFSTPGALGVLDAVLLIGAAILGSFLGTRLRFPAPTFLGPMAISALLHLTEVTQSAPPGMMVSAAQVILGCVLGCRFIGIHPRELASAAWLSFAATGITMILAVATGTIIQRWTGINLEQAMLALAPGGLTEMGLIALAIHADVAFVALNHVVRIIAVLVLAPVTFRLFRK